MIASLVLDLILVLFLIKTVYDCYRKGFLAVVIKVVGTVASFLLALTFSGPLSDWIYTRFLETTVVNTIAEKLPSGVGGLTMDGIGGLDTLMQFKDTAAAYISQALESLNPAWTFFSPADGAATTDAVVTQVQNGLTIAQAVAESAVRPTVTALLSIICFFVLFTVIMFVVKLLVRVGRGANEIPLVGGVNRLAGIAIGVVYAGVLGYIISMGLALVAGITGGVIPFLTPQVLADTWVIQFFMNFKFGEFGG